ncbi:MAG TPA: hypothetical protein VGJ20_34675 [Xanthobacteraceae bacterium]|jgi:hypothetical protein
MCQELPFPTLDCPVAGIVSPLWHGEKEHDDDEKLSQLYIFSVSNPAGQLRTSAQVVVTAS